MPCMLPFAATTTLDTNRINRRPYLCWKGNSVACMNTCVIYHIIDHRDSYHRVVSNDDDKFDAKRTSLIVQPIILQAYPSVGEHSSLESSVSDVYFGWYAVSNLPRFAAASPPRRTPSYFLQTKYRLLIILLSVFKLYMHYSFRRMDRSIGCWQYEFVVIVVVVVAVVVVVVANEVVD